MRRFVIASLLLLVPAVAGAEPERAERWIDLSRHAVAPAAPGPVLWLLGDGVEGDPRALVGDYNPPELPWQRFEGPVFSDFPFATNVLEQLLRTSAGDALDSGASLDLVGDAILTAGPPAALDELARHAAWWIRALAPTLRVEAVLRGDEGEERVLAAGGVSLVPGRWMRVWLAEHETPGATAWTIQIAEAATTMYPGTTEILEGRELYLCWHPGESHSVVEMWSGTQDVLEVRELDLSDVRNVPEGNAPGVLALPQQAVKRVYAAYTVPAAEPSERDVSWQGPGGPARLTLRFAPTSPVEALVREGSVPRFHVLRTGALGASLHRRGRASSADLLLDRVRGAAGEAEVEVDLISDELTSVRGPAAFLEGARALLKTNESALSTLQATLRVLAVPEAALRGPIASGQVRVGAAVATDVAERLRAEGGSVRVAVSLPTLAGVPAGFRVGLHATGLWGMSGQVAQSAAGLEPQVAARFSGVAGTLTARKAATGWRLALDAWLTWIDEDGGRLGLVFRPPVGMATGDRGLQDEPDFRRRVAFPILAGGRSRIDAIIDLPDAPGTEVVLALVPRGAEILLVVGSVR